LLHEFTKLKLEEDAVKTKRTQVAPTINQLWAEMQEFINSAHCDGSGTNSPEPLLKDYAENQSWTDALGRLLDAETVNERRHRTGRSRGWKATMSNVTAAKLILLGNFADGSEAKDMYPATIFLQWRHTAAEMCVVGCLCRGKAKISDDWRAEVRALDYAKLMAVSYV
jgi:hypothetical protein